MKTTLMLCAAFSLVGCATYQPRPLTDDSVHQALTPANPTSLASSASQLKHPRLHPIRIDFSQPLSEQALTILAVVANPDLKAQRAKESVAEAQVFAAGLLPDPRISGRIDLLFTGPASLVNPYSSAIAWDLAKLATRDTDRRIAERRAEQVRFDVAWQEWLTANQARLLARRWTYLIKQHEVADEAARVADELLSYTRQNVAAGDAKLPDLGLRQAAFLDAQDRALALARQLEKTRQDLNRILGIPPETSIAMDEALPPATPQHDPARLFAEAEKARLDLLAMRAGYASQDAALYRNILGQYPAFTLGLNDNHSYSNYNTGGPSVSFDVPLFNRNRGNIAIAETTREQLHQEYVARVHQTRADIATATADRVRIARECEPLIRELPELARVEHGLRLAVASGDATLVSYETVRANYLDKQLKLLALEQASAEQAVALQIAAGFPLLD